MTPFFELRVALRYLRSSRSDKRRLSLNTVISVAGVTVGVAALMATLGVMTGFQHKLRSKILGVNSHIVLTDGRGSAIPDPAQIEKVVASIPGVTALSPFIVGQAMISADKTVSGTVIRGVDPAHESLVTRIDRYMVEGHLSDLSRDRTPKPEDLPGVILGSDLADRLGVDVGDKVDLISPTGTPSAFGMIPKIRHFQVAGIFKSGLYEYDNTLALLEIGQAARFLGLPQGSVTGLEIRVHDIFAATDMAHRIGKKLGFPYWARSWLEMNKNLFSALMLEKLVMFIILVLIVLVASFNIVSTLSMIVIDKGKEIAILKTMGASNRQVMSIFILDGLLIGGFGTFLGLPLGYFITFLLEHYYTLPNDVYFVSHIPVIIRMRDLLAVSLSAVGISFLATIYPSRQAARLNPVDALRYE
ncbi:MAG: lipoprotein-releasing ABC transporter permease subunit [Nitrospirae bacterium]|uniref:Lipoprotein releasing system, transmembrane protein, LolC/E family n=1 Tax=Leptospirillum ferrodiazotrophum TaxID=412449 RepID=C6I0B5_9BACT|nr:MAG: lipoprotein releasing system, transmembrane protein, LolC/E family [Leptospirillum ferrodiazotrophum]MCL5954203.1 lipoprotein-releasing ABC transporter permease subunit [Nitrospirota bacterium]